MDLEPVPAGTLPAAALTLRGPDPMWWAANTYDFFVATAPLLPLLKCARLLP